MNFKQSIVDASVFMNDGKYGKVTIGDNDQLVQKFKIQMSNEFEMKDLGELNYLGFGCFLRKGI